MRGRAGKKMVAILFTTQDLAHIIIIHVKYVAAYLYTKEMQMLCQVLTFYQVSISHGK